MNGSPLRDWLDHVEKTGEIPEPPIAEPNKEIQLATTRKPAKSKGQNLADKLPPISDDHATKVNRRFPDTF